MNGRKAEDNGAEKEMSGGGILIEMRATQNNLQPVGNQVRSGQL